MPSWCDCVQRMVEPSMCGGCTYQPDRREEVTMTPLTPIERMKFVKVTIDDGSKRAAGHLTDVSIALLMVELERGGYEIVKRNADGETAEGK